jgi:hypothetical protein
MGINVSNVSETGNEDTKWIQQAEGWVHWQAVVTVVMNLSVIDQLSDY